MGHVFFDLDGTLTDPIVGITRCIQYALARLDLPAPPADELGWCIGPPLLESFQILVGEARAAQALKLYRERFGDVGWRENVPYDGIVQALTALAASELTLFVATAKPLVYAQQIIEHFHLDPYFDRVFGSELDGTRTGKTDLLKFALAETGCKGGATMIGDRSHDVIGARNNQMRTIAVTYGYGTRAELEGVYPDQVAERPADLVDLLL